MLTRITAQPLPAFPPGEERTYNCNDCQDTYSYEVYTVANDMKVIGRKEMIKLFGNDYHEHYTFLARHRCQRCFGSWETRYADTQAKFWEAKKRNDQTEAGLCQAKLYAMLKEF
jgi:hypothetical protein